MDIVKVFGTNLKKYRTKLGLSQEAFADKCGFCSNNLAKVSKKSQSYLLFYYLCTHYRVCGS